MQVQLTWSDNSNIETGQKIYASKTLGPDAQWQEIGIIAADLTTTTVNIPAELLDGPVYVSVTALNAAGESAKESTATLLNLAANELPAPKDYRNMVHEHATHSDTFMMPKFARAKMAGQTFEMPRKHAIQPDGTVLSFDYTYGLTIWDFKGRKVTQVLPGTGNAPEGHIHDAAFLEAVDTPFHAPGRNGESYTAIKSGNALKVFKTTKTGSVLETTIDNAITAALPIYPFAACALNSGELGFWYRDETSIQLVRYNPTTKALATSKLALSKVYSDFYTSTVTKSGKVVAALWQPEGNSLLSFVVFNPTTGNLVLTETTFEVKDINRLCAVGERVFFAGGKVVTSSTTDYTAWYLAEVAADATVTVTENHHSQLEEGSGLAYVNHVGQVIVSTTGLENTSYVLCFDITKGTVNKHNPPQGQGEGVFTDFIQAGEGFYQTGYTTDIIEYIYEDKPDLSVEPKCRLCNL